MLVDSCRLSRYIARFTRNTRQPAATLRWLSSSVLSGCIEATFTQYFSGYIARFTRNTRQPAATLRWLSNPDSSGYIEATVNNYSMFRLQVLSLCLSILSAQSLSHLHPDLQSTQLFHQASLQCIQIIQNRPGSS